MRVGIDVSILSSRLTGIGYFTLCLVRSLSQLKGNDEWVLLGADPSFDGVPRGENVKVHTAKGLTGWRRIAWQQFTLPRLASQYGLDVLHCTDFSRPINISIPVVNTIHDLSYYSSHAFFSLANRTYKRALTQITVRKDTEIVSVSNFTREEVMKRFGLDGRRIHVIHHGVDPTPLGERFQGAPPYILYIGTLEERKNLLALIQGFTLMRSQGDILHRLILAGKPGRGFSKIKAAIRSSPSGNAIDIPGYVSRDKSIQLYRGADALVLPSLYEGFGIPVLEAMSLGTPAVCSWAASLPEVGGDAVEYFDPASPQDLAAALTKVLGSPTLQSEMRQRGLARAKLFSWDECARRYLEVYRNVLDHDANRPQSALRDRR